MLGFSLARLSGIVVVLFATMWMVIQLGDRDWPEAGLALCLLVTALALAVWGDRRMDQAKKQRESARQREGEAYQGFEREVGLRWFKWGALTLFFGGVLGAVFYWALPDLWHAGQRGKAMAVGGVTLLFAWAWLALLPLGFRALQGQALLQIGPLGLQMPLLPLLPWSQVQGADLQAIDVKGSKQWQLMLATDDAYLQLLPSRWWMACFLWPMVRLPRKAPVIGISLAFLDDNPHTVLQAVRHIGTRHGAPLVEGWHHAEPIAEARESRRLQREAADAMQEVDRSLEELQRIGSGALPDPERLAALNSRVAIELERMQSTSQASAAHFVARGNRSMQHFRSAMRGLWIVFGLIMVWVVVRIALALTR
ncbi:MAG: hypothetical protein KAF64_02170 [Hydrogenophaga sp.]|uniref:hypothetical protein n=1 Tax=Hydrogenophaga sp. TaxID=1904254 RepID=UPI0025C21E13|nr:hypothetical protein [Hydrogenophaga sp.]MBU7572133.1 hypothetical protein [Hydrogenophaga sp.]